MITIDFRFPAGGTTSPGSTVAAASSARLSALGVALLLAALLCVARLAPAQQTSDVADGLVGSWTLAAVEREIAGGDPVRVRRASGLLVIDSVGHVFEFFEAPGAAVTTTEPEDRRQAFAEFGGFWGRYRLTGDGRIAFEAEAGVSPNVRGASFTRTFALDGEELVITSAQEPQAQADKRWTWQKVPTVENLSPMFRDVVGFWHHIEERRVNLTTGEVEEVRQRDPSVIVYTPSGYLGVHFPALGREPFAGTVPSADEAAAAWRRYIGYYGALGLYPGEVAHNVLAGTQPGTGSILRRFAEISGDEAVLTLPSNRASDDGDRFATTVHMRRLSGIEEMLPRR